MAKIDIFAETENDVITKGIAGLKIMLYGGNNVGKTLQATKFPKPMLLMAESGGSAIPIKHKYAITEWQTFVDIVKQLTKDSEKTKELFETIIVDTSTELVNRCEEMVCRRYGVQDIGSVQQAQKGNPNGYTLSRQMLREQINKLTNAGFCVIFIDHGMIIEKTDPITGEDYEQMVPAGTKNQNSSQSFIKDLCDYVFCVQSNGINPETKKVIYSKAQCFESKTCFARARFAGMQTIINPFTAENVIKAIEESQERQAEEYGVDCVEFSYKSFNYTADDYKERLRPVFKTLADAGYGEWVTQQCDKILGCKISKATEDQKIELEQLLELFELEASRRGLIWEE